MVRPSTDVEWKTVDEMLMAGCLGTEVAAYYGIHPDTFYKKVEQQKGMGFTAYLQEKRSKGDALLRTKQYEKALKGDNTLLIWLGKNRLEQRESPQEHTVNEDVKKDLSQIQMLLSQLQSARKTEISNVVKEDKSESVAEDNLA